MNIPFSKYQGTGNDFVMIDQRKVKYLKKKDQALIAQLCDRHFGIGADGLIFLEIQQGALVMTYFNSDGSESTMCGNGGRCFAAFCKQLGLAGEHIAFQAIDGLHRAEIAQKETDKYQIELQMIDVEQLNQIDSMSYTVETGSPHFVQFTDQPVSTFDMKIEGKKVRYSPAFEQKGINVNLVQIDNDGLTMRTYERGVEDETLSCGTGVTAAAIAHHHLKYQDKEGTYKTQVQILGGKLEVKFDFKAQKGYSNVWLCGPAVRVFSGQITV
jgi:diaminopimelate epimerase